MVMKDPPRALANVSALRNVGTVRATPKSMNATITQTRTGRYTVSFKDIDTGRAKRRTFRTEREAVRARKRWERNNGGS